MDEIEETTVGIPESVIINGVTYVKRHTGIAEICTSGR